MKKSTLNIAAVVVLIMIGATLSSCEKEDVKPFYNSNQKITVEGKNHVREATPFEYKINKDDAQSDVNIPREKDIDRPLQTEDGINNVPVSDSI